MDSSKSKLYLLIFCVVILSVFPADVILPAMPQLSEELAIALNFSLMSVSGYLLVLGIATAFTGILADHFGVKPVIFGCLSVSALGSFICYLSSNAQWFMIGRFIEAAGASAFPLIHAVIRQNFTGSDANSLRFFVTVLSGGLISAAPLLGALILDVTHWRILFLLFFLFAILTSFLLQTTIINQTVPDHNHGSNSHSNTRFWLYNVVALCCFLVHFSFILISVHIFMVHFAFDETAYGLWMLIYGSAYVCSGAFYARKMQRFALEKQIWMGILLILGSCISLTILPIYSSPLLMILSVSIAATGVAFIQPAAVTLALDAVPVKNSGRYTSLLSLTKFFLGGLCLTFALFDVEAILLNLASLFFILTITAMILHIIGSAKVKPKFSS